MPNDGTTRYYFPEGMVRTFTHEEPSSFETLGSQFSLSWKPIRTFVFGLQFETGTLVGPWSDPKSDPGSSAYTQHCVLSYGEICSLFANFQDNSTRILHDTIRQIIDYQECWKAFYYTSDIENGHFWVISSASELARTHFGTFRIPAILFSVNIWHLPRTALRWSQRVSTNNFSESKLRLFN